MFRNLLGFAIFAVIAIFLFKIFLGLFGLLIGLLLTIAWFAFIGFVIYLILKLIAPDTAARLREMIAGRPAVSERSDGQGKVHKFSQVSHPERSEGGMPQRMAPSLRSG